MLVDSDSYAALTVLVVVHAARPALLLLYLVHLPLPVVVVLPRLGLPQGLRGVRPQSQFRVQRLHLLYVFFLLKSLVYNSINTFFGGLGHII